MNTIIDRPAFDSPELQAALDKARETLEGADEVRNRVSHDIKALESYLAIIKDAARQDCGESLEAQLPSGDTGSELRLYGFEDSPIHDGFVLSCMHCAAVHDFPNVEPIPE